MVFQVIARTYNIHTHYIYVSRCCVLLCAGSHIFLLLRALRAVCICSPHLALYQAVSHSERRTLKALSLSFSRLLQKQLFFRGQPSLVRIHAYVWGGPNQKALKDIQSGASPTCSSPEAWKLPNLPSHTQRSHQMNQLLTLLSRLLHSISIVLLICNQRKINILIQKK